VEVFRLGSGEEVRRHRNENWALVVDEGEEEEIEIEMVVIGVIVEEEEEEAGSWKESRALHSVRGACRASQDFVTVISNKRITALIPNGRFEGWSWIFPYTPAPADLVNDLGTNNLRS
jgi:hypothetical protein